MNRGIGAIRAIALNKSIHLDPLIFPRWRRNAESPYPRRGRIRKGSFVDVNPQFQPYSLGIRASFYLRAVKINLREKVNSIVISTGPFQKRIHTAASPRPNALFPKA
jgi:hypothetical protein